MASSRPLQKNAQGSQGGGLAIPPTLTVCTNSLSFSCLLSDIGGVGDLKHLDDGWYQQVEVIVQTGTTQAEGTQHLCRAGKETSGKNTFSFPSFIQQSY